MYLTMLVKWPHSRLGHTAWLVVMFAGAVGPGLLLYRWVERPLLNLVKRKKAEAAAIPLPTPAASPVKRAA
jgi:peptidoglycan/LPS O-acetylase OafA/YrhL